MEPEQAAQRRTFALVQSLRVDGLILAGPDIPARFVLKLHASGLPIVLVDNTLSEMVLDSVLGDDSSSAYDATRHLFEHGYRTIASISGPRSWVSSRERTIG